MGRKNSSFLNSNWKKYLFELLVIVTGITISFALQNWQEASEHRRLEIQTLERLLIDLRADTADMHLEIEAMENAVQFGQWMMDTDDFAATSDSAGLFISSQLQYTLFAKSDVAYQGLRQFGRSDIISNETLLNQVVHQYNVSYRVLEEWNAFDKNFISNQFIPHFIQHFPSSQNKSPEVFFSEINRAMQDDVFRNLVFFNVSNKRQALDKYQENLESVVKLMGDIEKELERLR